MYMNATKAIRVLIAEDELPTVRLLQRFLKDMGYTTAGKAPDGRRAVKMTRTLKPDVVLMDLELPGMGGIKTAREISDTCPTPIVILADRETLELATEASAAGAGAYVIKPPTPDTIEHAITAARAQFHEIVRLHEENADLHIFAGAVAHELKESISTLIGFAELLEEYHDTMSEAEIQLSLKNIRKKGRKAAAVIDDLFKLAETCHHEVKLVPLDMTSIVGEALDQLAYLIEDSHAEIVLPESWPTALGYGPWVERIWVNYVSNAIKYGGSPPRLELGAEVETPERTTTRPATVRFWVRDNGQGIPQRIQERLFVSCTRLPNDQIEGHGLGLSIVHRIVEKLGGEVGVWSEKDQGSTVYFTLLAG